VVADLEARLASQRELFLSIQTDQGAFNESSIAIAAAIERLQDQAAADVYRLRAAVASRLKDVLAKIWVYPGGDLKPDLLQEQGEESFPGWSISGERTFVATPDKRYRRFDLDFKGGSIRSVVPSATDPRLLDQLSGTDEPYVTDSLIRANLKGAMKVEAPTQEQMMAVMAEPQADKVKLTYAVGYEMIFAMNRSEDLTQRLIEDLTVNFDSGMRPLDHLG